MASGTRDKNPVEAKTEESYLSSAVKSINPWGAKRATSPTPGTRQEGISQPTSTAASVDPGDHSTSHLYGHSFRNYPADCPPLNVQWFHAVDIPKRRPKLGYVSKPSPDARQPVAVPKKYSAFSKSDSKSIEIQYQRLLEAAEDDAGQAQEADVGPHASKQKRSLNARIPTQVPVNEDFLFDVNIEERELGPVYWLGPIYEVRRGTWFFQEGSVLRPCEENLAAQLEEGYLKTRPWLNPARSRSQSNAKQATPRHSNENLRSGPEAATATPTPASKQGSLSATPVPPNDTQPQSYRLFGTYMNSSVTYQDATTAFLSSDTVLSWVTSSMYERFAGGGYMSGIRLTRGYSEPAKNKDKDKLKEGSKDDIQTSETPEKLLSLDERQQKLLKRRSAPPTTTNTEDSKPSAEGQRARLQRQLSSLIESEGQNAEHVEEQLQRRQEQEIEGYHTQAGESQGRRIDHLILVTHGIGQQLGLRMDSVNFVQDVNTLRKTMKSIYAESQDLRALNSELEDEPGNCRVQVLPVCWRHLLQFPKQHDRRREHDLGDFDEDEDNYPSLDDITIEGVAFARSLISDLALDVLLYQSSYRSQISKIVRDECNRIFELFKKRNPEFKGKVHVVGHSLGSAIFFDILSRQRDNKSAEEKKNPLRFLPQKVGSDGAKPKTQKDEIQLNFEVGDFYCLGSPIGLFQMLEGRTIAARRPGKSAACSDWAGLGTADDPLQMTNSASVGEVLPTEFDLQVSSPKSEQLFNIFHPSDPISYRLEPLISPAMASLKPQGLPYTKKGIFGNVTNQGLTGIGAKVGQSMSGLWSSLSAGIASNIINRSLGLSNEEMAQFTDQTPRPLDVEKKIAQSDVLTEKSKIGEKADERKKQLANSSASGPQATTSGNDPTLIDDELETLFSKFQKTRADGEGRKVHDEQSRARKLRLEEAKVRALNRNGRVDYSIQESVLDFNPINTIASHLTYWGDVDVSHFILSQLLSNRGKPIRGDIAADASANNKL